MKDDVKIETIDKLLRGCKKDFIYERNGYLFSVIEKENKYAIVVMKIDEPTTRKVLKVVEIGESLEMNYSSEYSEFVKQCQYYLLKTNNYFVKQK